MKELMQCRHELEASRRLHAEYAERTHAAEKGAAKAKELMHEAQLKYQRLESKHEEVQQEVQLQRNRVAKMRILENKRKKEEAGGGAAHTAAGESVVDGGNVLALEERPKWNNDVIVLKDPNCTIDRLRAVLSVVRQ